MSDYSGPPAEEARGTALGGWPEAVPRIAFWASAITLAFLAGAWSVLDERFPGPQIARAYQGGQALLEKAKARQDVYASDLWQAERRPDRGVTRHDARAQDGVTLYTSGHAPAAFLIAMDGTLLHEWRRPFSTIWNPGAPEARPKTPQPDEFVFFRKARILPKGELIALYEAAGDTPYGYGIVKLDAHSNVLWSYLGAAHHDFDVGPDGRIYVLTQAIVDDPPKVGVFATPRIEDFLVILGPDGREQKTIRLVNSVAQSRWSHLLHTVAAYAVGDPLHANTVKLLTEDMAGSFPYGKPGQVLLSFRELGTIGVLDTEEERLVWAARGPWLGQHDPDLLPDGNILLFDNYGHFAAPEGMSRVIEFRPQTMEIVWQYTGTPEEPFWSEIRSWQQRLPNGNTLIVESNGGRIFEVTRTGDIVWEFLNPVRHAPGGNVPPKIPVIGWAERLDPATLDPSLLQAEPSQSALRTAPPPAGEGAKPEEPIQRGRKML